jgi:hypothetical protein
MLAHLVHPGDGPAGERSRSSNISGNWPGDCARAISAHVICVGSPVSGGSDSPAAEQCEGCTFSTTHINEGVLPSVRDPMKRVRAIATSWVDDPDAVDWVRGMSHALVYGQYRIST